LTHSTPHSQRIVTSFLKRSQTDALRQRDCRLLRGRTLRSILAR
jgi:hypothetical protein